MNVDDIVEIGATSLLESGFYEWIQPSSNSIKLAFKLRMLGHKTILTIILYAIPKTNNLIDHISLLKKLKK